MNPELQQKLEALHGYLSTTEGIDDEVRGELLGSLKGIESAVVAEDEAETHHGALDKLKATFADLETSHPHAAEIVRDLSYILSRMGI
ncbi:MAG: DUF4404 family protein [Verrucomicrobiota bacterium]